MSRIQVITRWSAFLLLASFAFGCNNATLQKRAVLGKHWGTVTSLIFTPDGKRLIVGSGHRSSLGPRGDLAIWDVETLKRVRYTKVRANYYAFALTPDGKQLVAMERFRVDIWDLDSFKRVGKIREGVWCAMALSPDGKSLALVDRDDNDIHIFDLDSRKRSRTLKGCYSSVTFSPDGKTLAAGEGIQYASGKVLRGTGTIYLWDTGTWNRRTWKDPATPKGICQTSDVAALQLSPNGKLIFSSAWNSYVWSVEQEKVQATFTVSLHPHATAFSPDSRFLATASDKLEIWEAETARKLAEAEAHERGIWSVAFSPNGMMLATGGNDDRTVILWELTPGH